jgi:uncharacterized protein YndB with AHSA1/START domain
MNSLSELLEVRREIPIEASLETVWELLTDPVKAQTWWGAKAEFDLREGGVFRMEVTANSIASGKFTEIDAPRRLAFTFGWEKGGGGAGIVPPGSSTVMIELVPTDTGTLVRLVHWGLPNLEAVQAHGDGWDHYFGRLVTVARGGDPGPDPWAQAPPA